MKKKLANTERRTMIGRRRERREKIICRGLKKDKKERTKTFARNY